MPNGVLFTYSPFGNRFQSEYGAITECSQSAKDSCQYFKSEPDMDNALQAYIIIGWCLVGTWRLANVLYMSVLFVSCIYCIQHNSITDHNQTTNDACTFYVSAESELRQPLFVLICDGLSTS